MPSIPKTAAVQRRRLGLQAVAGPVASPSLSRAYYSSWDAAQPRRARWLRAAGAPSGATPDGLSHSDRGSPLRQAGRAGTGVDGDFAPSAGRFSRLRPHRTTKGMCSYQGMYQHRSTCTGIEDQGRRERTGAGAPPCRRFGPWVSGRYFPAAAGGKKITGPHWAGRSWR